MEFKTFVFYFLSAILVFAGLRVITARNPVHAALFLVLAFFTASGVWILLQAEFLAMALVLVYVGAVMVLFLFVVMMLDIKPDSMREGFIRFLPVGVIVAVVMLAQMLSLIGLKTLQAVPLPASPEAAAGSNTAWLGHALFTKFLLPFEIAALILTVALIAAVALTLRKRSGVRTQKPGQQVLVQRDERLRVVKMASEAPKTGEAP